MQAAVKLHLRFLVINGVGILLFLMAASQFWIEPELADVPGANGGNAFGWIIYAAPVAAAFVVGNVIWLLWSVLKAGQTTARAWHVGFALVAFAAWVTAYYFDNAHHGI